MNTTNYLDRMLQPITEAMNTEFANKLVSLRADDDLLPHIEQLRGKANQGTMMADEEAEYREFVEAVDVISILQAKSSHFIRHAILSSQMANIRSPVSGLDMVRSMIGSASRKYGNALTRPPGKATAPAERRSVTHIFAGPSGKRPCC